MKPLKNDTEFSYPRALYFQWEGGFPSYVFELSKSEDFADAYKLTCREPSCEIKNFEIGRKYFWRVNGGRANYFFTKNNKFRFIKIDGALNVRDLGGNLIKQGMIYRGTDIVLCYKITEEGKRNRTV